MRLHWIVTVAFFVAACAAWQSASAQTLAYAARGTTNLRAGPGTQYAIIARVRGGTPVDVHGCLANRAWCSVTAGPNKNGWMAASRLLFRHGGDYVRVPDYFLYFDVPIIRFHRRHRCHDRHKCGPVPPPCPFPDPRQCQPLRGGEKVVPNGWGPDYPPGYKPGDTGVPVVPKTTGPIAPKMN